MLINDNRLALRLSLAIPDHLVHDGSYNIDEHLKEVEIALLQPHQFPSSHPRQSIAEQSSLVPEALTHRTDDGVFVRRPDEKLDCPGYSGPGDTVVRHHPGGSGL